MPRTMLEIVSPLTTDADLARLQVALVADLAQSGMPLPEDDTILDFVIRSLRFGNMRAALAVQDGEAVGMVAWRVEGEAGFIMLFCVLADAPPPAAGLLLGEALRDLTSGRAPRGVYVELPGGSPALHVVLAAAGFVGVERIIMQCDLRLHAADPGGLPSGYALSSWEDACLPAAADVIYQANIGTVDAMIIPEMQSLASTRRIVFQVLQGRYGLFDAAASGVIRAGDEVVGVTLVTRRSNGPGFTAEICVQADHRRRGLARQLMLHTHAALRADGMDWNTLGVTAGNPARRLYEALGYAPFGAMRAYVYPRPAGWPA